MVEQKPTPFIPPAGAPNFNNYTHRKAASQELKIREAIRAPGFKVISLAEALRRSGDTVLKL